jgi:hypothetical protein
VQEANTNAYGVKFHLCQDVRHGERVVEIRFARLPDLALMPMSRKLIGPLDQPQVIVRVIFFNRCQNVFETYHAMYDNGNGMKGPTG